MHRSERCSFNSANTSNWKQNNNNNNSEQSNWQPTITVICRSERCKIVQKRWQHVKIMNWKVFLWQNIRGRENISEYCQLVRQVYRLTTRIALTKQIDGCIQMCLVRRQLKPGLMLVYLRLPAIALLMITSFFIGTNWIHSEFTKGQKTGHNSTVVRVPKRDLDCNI